MRGVHSSASCRSAHCVDALAQHPAFRTSRPISLGAESNCRTGDVRTNIRLVNNRHLQSAPSSQCRFAVFVSESSMHLFDRVTFGNVTLRNRIVVSPMCEYSAV